MPTLSYNPDEPQYPQTASWTCSACSLAWINRALSIDFATTEWEAVEYIGSPENINSTYGLMDGSGAVLAARLREQGAPAFCAWLEWGAAWYHGTGVRNAREDTMYLANSAPGWMGIDQELSDTDWWTLGPFAVVAVPLLAEFPAV